MDNIIKIYLRQTGGLAELSKTIPLYVGMYNTAVLNVYVPDTLVSDGISVKVGAILTADDGTKATTNSLPMSFKENTNYRGQDYAVYELNPFPANFLSYAGIQDIIVNIVTLDEEEVESVVTTQICQIDVLDSALIPDETLSTSAVDIFNARITTNEQNIATNTDNITANTGQIEQNTEDISANAQRISDLEDTIITGENYVGALSVDTLTGIDTKLNQLVQQTESRQAQNGDVIMVTLQISGQTDEIYKYLYTASGWKSVKMPAIESASNTDKGIVQGTLGEDRNTQVDITGGKINAIYVKDNNGTLRDTREYINTNKTSIDNIISGDTKVGYAQKADNDANNNNIVDTYLTKNAGVTKTEMKEYALPREFNDLFYLGKDFLNNPIISADKPAGPITFTKNISQIGTYTLINAQYVSDASFELSNKNSYQFNVFISADADITTQFRLDFWFNAVNFSTELTNEIVMTANNVYKVQFYSNFNELEGVIDFSSDKFSVVLSVVSTSTADINYTIYQNSTYVSTFNLNTNKYVIEMQEGRLGEIVEISSTGTLGNGIVTFGTDKTIYDNTLIKFVLSYQGENLNDYIKLVNTETNEEYAIKTPYNTNNRPQIKDFIQTSVTVGQGNTVVEFVGLANVIDGYGTEIIVNEDDISGKLDKNLGIANAGKFLQVDNSGDVEPVTLPQYQNLPAQENGTDLSVVTTGEKYIWNNKQDALNQTQMDAVNSGANTTNIGQIATNTSNISSINDKIPNQASSSNQLADKDFVNSSINALAAFYITRTAQGDNFNTNAQLMAATTFYSGGTARIPTQNDYTYVRWDETKGEVVAGYTSFTTTSDYIGHLVIYNNEGVVVDSSNKDSLGITAGTTVAYENLPTTRYSYQGGTYPNGQWDFQLIVNNSALTAAQIAAINSGITSTLVTQIGTNTTDIANKMDKTNPTGTGSLSINRKANTTVGANSVAIGNNTTASGTNSTALGTSTTASGFASHAEGNNSVASGDNSHAENAGNTARGDYSHVQGNNNISYRRSQHVFGEYNVADQPSGTTFTDRGTYVEIVGNGTSASRSNARTLDWSGNEVLSGTLQTTGLKDGNNANYKLALPNTTSWTGNKTIATTDELPSSSNISYYGTCTSSATAQVKIVDCPNFVLEEGVSIRVKFTNRQNYSGSGDLSLNVNGTGAIAINGISGSSGNYQYLWRDGEMVSFTYDGEAFLVEDGAAATTNSFGYVRLSTNADGLSNTLVTTVSAVSNIVTNIISSYPTYSSSSTYSVGDRVRYMNVIYECVTAITTAESWDASHWTQVDDLQTQILGVGTRVSTLENSGFITKSVDDLTNYYLKTETYTKSEVNSLIGAIPEIKVEVAQTLPTAGETYYFNESKTIYLAPKTTAQTSNAYDEYICTRSGTEGSYTYAWEKIGDTEIDLSNYVTLDSAQTISGAKTFSNAPILSNGVALKAYSTAGIARDLIILGGGNTIGIGNSYHNIRVNTYSYLAPYSNGDKNLGSTNYKWKDLYLAGQIKDGNNSDYGLALPNSTSWTANKTIATTEYVDDLVGDIETLLTALNTGQGV